jgi:phosphotransferase system HPr (HPr) family protein
MPGSRRRVKITNELGLHLRAANRLVQLAQHFQSEVRVSWNGRVADGKSILDLMTLGAEFGTLLELEASGPDSEEAAAALCELVASRFHEDTIR